MKFILKARIPVEAGNQMIRDPNFAKLLENIMGDLRPENAYFCVEDGQRTIYLVVNAEGAHEVPRLVEPLWLSMKADVTMIPAMSQEDFGKAMPLIGAAVQKYR